MPDLKTQAPSRQSALVRQGGGPGQTRTLQTANKEALNHLGLPSETPGDPKGRVLRQLRLQIGIDPSLLATQACMSLSQLYELEDGGNSRFYSDSLRRQAGRRVARLLGADWDNMELAERNFVHTSSNVVPLQRPIVSPVPAQVAEPKQQTDPTQDQSITMAADHKLSIAPQHESQALFMGLATPALETVLVEPNSHPYILSTPAAQKSSSFLRTVLVLLMVISLGVAAAYVFVEYSPYRIYWPW
jgi:hypothetical protein